MESSRPPSNSKPIPKQLEERLLQVWLSEKNSLDQKLSSKMILNNADTIKV